MKQASAFKAGIFIVLMVALAIGMILAIAGTGSLFRDVNEYIVEFESGENVSNIRPDGQVRVLGVPTGRVRTVRAVPTENGAVVEVLIQLDAEFKIRETAMVRASSSLTGDAWLDIEGLGQGAVVSNGGRIDGESSGLANLIDEARELVPTAREALAKINSAADEAERLVLAAREHVDPIAADIKYITERGGIAADHLSDLLGDTKTDLRSSITSLRSTLDTADQRLPGTLDRVDRTLDDTRMAFEDVTGFLTDARATFARVDRILEEFQPASEDARATLAELRQTIAESRPKLDRTLTNLSRASDDAAGAVVEIRAAPWRLLSRPTADQDRNLALYTLARQYARGAQDLESAARALQTAGQTADIDDAMLEKLRRDLASRHERFGQFEQELWQALQD
ncbi:MAG: MlaD family protein [Planctomycetota bacterium]